MKKNILTISDQPNFHSVIEAIFRGWHNLFFAETEKVALSVLENEKVNLILLTPHVKTGTEKSKQVRPIKAQDKDSFKLLERLRASGKRYAEVPAILASPLVTADEVAKSHKHKVSDIIKLPFDPLVLDDKAAETLAKFSPSRERPDPLTGLPKKQMGELSIAELLNEGKKGTLMMLDLDHYSFIGTAISDKTLLACRNIIQEEIDDKAVLAVIKSGGFLLFVPELREKEKVQDYAKKLIKKILDKMEKGNEKIYVSIGLAVSERHGKNYEDLCLACDRGLGEARKHGKNVAKFYSW